MYDYDKLPEQFRDTVQLYVEHGIPMGGFLTAVFANDLFESVARADHCNKPRIADIVVWVYNEAPNGCWRSYDVVKAWRGTKHEEKV